MFDFPNTPLVGQTVSNGAVSYEWDGVKWTVAPIVTTSGDGGGDITSVTAGSGLMGGGTVGDVTLAMITPVPYGSLPTEVQQVPIAFQFTGKPAASGEVNLPMPMAVTVPASLAGTVSYQGDATTADAVFTLNKVSGGTPTVLGTITLTTGPHVLTGSGGSVAVGDTLQLVAPAVPDATLADLGITVMTMRV